MKALQCEVCGRKIHGKPYKAIIEGARLVVCVDCAALGSLSWELKTPRRAKPHARVRKSLTRKSQISAKRRSPLEPTLDLVADFGNRIRNARERRGLSHEELGRKINEKTSLLRKLESHKIRPDNRLAEKLQHVLKIKLLVPTTKQKIPKDLLATASPSKGVTLGDLIKNQSNKSEDTK